MKRLKSIDELTKLSQDLAAAQDPDRVIVTLCGGTGCTASGSGAVKQAFQQELDKRSLTEKMDVKITGCHGFCAIEPIVVTGPAGIMYQRVEPDDVTEIVGRTVEGGQVIERLLHVDPPGCVFSPPVSCPVLLATVPPTHLPQQARHLDGGRVTIVFAIHDHNRPQSAGP